MEEKMERELTKDLFEFRDFSYEDFKKLLEERRLEVLTTMGNCPFRALLQLAFNPYKVYTSGVELQKELLKYLKIPYDELYEYKDFIPISPTNYWNHARHIMSRVNLVTEVEITPTKRGYALTSFGNYTKSFVAYMLKRTAEVEINPWELFGKTALHKGKRAPVVATKILEFVYQKGRTSRNEIAKGLMIHVNSVPRHLKRFEKLGLIEYKSLTAISKEYKKYKVDRRELEEILENWDKLEIREKIENIRKKLTINYELLKEAFEYLRNRKEVDGEELKKLYGPSYLSIISALWNLGAIDSEIEKGKESKVEITEKGKKVYELMIKPVIEVSENPDSIENYRDELNDEDKRKVIWLYSEWKGIHGKRGEIILKVLERDEGLRLEEISKITGINKKTVENCLRRLGKNGLVRNENGEWRMAKHVG